MEIIKNNKGGQKLCYQGYCYTKKAKSSISQRWECDQRDSQKCRAIATTDLEFTVVKSVTEHTHAADMFKVSALKVREEIWSGLSGSRGTTGQIVIDKLAQQPAEVRVAAGTLETLKRTARKRKRQDTPSEPKSASDIPIPLPNEYRKGCSCAMPRRKQVNYGVQRKYKYSRHVTKIKSYPTSLEDGSVLDEDHSKTKNQDDLQEMGDSSEFCIQTKDSDHSNFTIDIKTEPASDYFEEHINAYETHFPNIITKVAENVERVSDCFKDHIQTHGLNSSEYVPEVYIKVEPASDYPEEEQYMECPKDTSKRDVEKIASVSVNCNDNIETVSTDNILKHTYIKVEPSSMDFQDRSVINDKKTLDNPKVPAVKVKALPLGVIENIVTDPINNPTERIMKVERSLIDSDDHTDTYNMNGHRIPTVCVFNLKPTVEYCNDHSQILGAGLSKNNAENYVKDTQQGYDNSSRRIVEINNELNYHIETNSVETPEMDLETVEEIKQEKEISECENFDHNAVSFSKLQTDVKANIREAFLVHADNRKLSLFQLYTKGGAASVKLSIEVHSDFSCNLFVHRQSVPLTHSIWGGLPLLFDQCSSIMELCSRVQLHKVCPGNPDEEFVPFSPIGDGFNLNLAKPLRAFREGDFNVTYGKTGDKSYSRTIRTSNCQLLVREADQCIKCKEYRSSLMTRKRHVAETADLNGSNVNTKFNGMMMSADMAKKLQEQKEKIHDLTREINKLRTKIKKHKQKQSDAKKLYV